MALVTILYEVSSNVHNCLYYSHSLLIKATWTCRTNEEHQFPKIYTYSLGMDGEGGGLKKKGDNIMEVPVPEVCWN
jgi:hypothetical protein